MQVEVEDGLLRAGAAVEDGAVVGMAQFAHEAFGDDEEAADQFPVAFFNIVKGGDYLLGDDENVHRGLRPDVVDCDILVVLVGDLCGDLPGDDFFEKCLGHSFSI